MSKPGITFGARTLFCGTGGTAIQIPGGSRILAPVTLSNGTGAASSTISVGLRNSITKVASDATAILAATSLTTAGTAQFNTGTKVTAGQFYTTTEPSEVFLTFGGATPTANQAIRVEFSFVSP